MNDIDPSPQIDSFSAIDRLQQTVADEFAQLANACCAARGSFTVSLSGGSTPRRLYELLAQRDLPWDCIHWFWGDERNVAHDHDDSNYQMVKRALLDHVAIPDANIHAVPVMVDHPGEAARAYESTIQRHFDASLPAWDLVLLGMGDDAHTASLFPGTKAITSEDRTFVENWVPKFDAFRYTLTAPAINSGAEIWFLVAGAAKQQALKDVWGQRRDPDRFPSQMILPTRWFVTTDALT